MNSILSAFVLDKNIIRKSPLGFSIFGLALGLLGRQMVQPTYGTFFVC